MRFCGVELARIAAPVAPASDVAVDLAVGARQWTEDGQTFEVTVASERARAIFGAEVVSFNVDASRLSEFAETMRSTYGLEVI